MGTENVSMPLAEIERRIYFIRGQKVMLDKDLAAIYGVKTKALNQAVKRNADRFPKDFMFQLSWDETGSLRSQIVTLKRGRHIKFRPYVFTEHGAIMAATVLNSPVAVAMSVQVVRAFVRLREMVAAHKELAGKLDELERKYQTHDKQIITIIQVIRQLMAPPEGGKGKIGFRPK